MRVTIILFFLLSTNVHFCQEVKEIEIDSIIKGELTLVNSKNSNPLVILTQGSWPTDRNGNQGMMMSNHSKLLTDSLKNRGINSFRYDKRTIHYINRKSIPNNIKFNDFVLDLVKVIRYFKKNGFTNIHLIGHSQGSLVSLKAADIEPVKSIISIAGTARTIDLVLTEQITAQYPSLKSSLKKSFKELREKDTIVNVNPFLKSIFLPQNQKFINSWVKINPAEVLKKLDETPILVIHGTKDIQVPIEDAKKIDSIANHSKLIEIKNMNHVFRIIEGDRNENLASYSNPKQPISSEMIKAISTFVTQ